MTLNSLSQHQRVKFPNSNAISVQLLTATLTIKISKAIGHTMPAYRTDCTKPGSGILNGTLTRVRVSFGIIM